MLLTKDQILAAEDIKTDTVPVPEWGGEVQIKMLTGTEYGQLQATMHAGKSKDAAKNLIDFYARLAASSIVSPGGARMFSASEVATLGGKSAAALQRVCDSAMKFNRIGADAVDELTKNSEADQT